MNTVELYYNPYRVETRIRINGIWISDYSILNNFTKEPFEEWFEIICEKIYQEINSEYELLFCSREYETAIMEQMSSLCPACVRFRALEPELNITTAKRMSMLSRFLKKNPGIHCNRIEIHIDCVLIPAFRQLKSRIEALEVRNVFCNAVFHVFETEGYRPSKRGIPFLFIDKKSVGQIEADFRQMGGFILIQGCKNRFLRKDGDFLVYEYEPAGMEAAVFEIMLYGPLLEAMRICRKSVELELVKEPELLVLDAMEPVAIIKRDYQVEVGYEVPVDIHIYPAGVQILLKYYTENESIACCQDGRIRAKTKGDTRIRICNEKNGKEIQMVFVHVYETNHIQRIVLESRHMVLPVNGYGKINYSFEPADADDITELRWKSADKETVQVDAGGIIYGRCSGKTEIYLGTGKVSASCQIWIQEKLRDLRLSAEKLEIPLGSHTELYWDTVPENSYEEAIYTYIENKGIISYYNKKVYGEHPGETEIIFYNQNRTIEKTCHITVTAKEKCQKGKQTGKGLLKSIFG